MSLTGKVAVVTGATSGIGYATAIELARKGADIVLASRSEDALSRVQKEIEALGKHALAVPCDVARWEDVQNVAQRAVERFERIDIWINNASVAVWSPVEDLSINDIDRTIRVNLLGSIYGCKAALPVMRENHTGVIINVASVLAERSVPLLSTYCASKHGLKGFTESLRLELAHEPDIHVVLVLPSAINTPFYSEGKSNMGVRPHPLPPVYEPTLVARTIVRAAEKPRRDVYVGGIGRLLALAQRLSPNAVDVYMTSGDDRMARKQITSEPDRAQSNLYTSGSKAIRDGEFGHETRRTSVYTELFQIHRVVSNAAMAFALVAAGAMLVRALKK